jgi:hypothetical protein
VIIIGVFLAAELGFQVAPLGFYFILAHSWPRLVPRGAGPLERGHYGLFLIFVQAFRQVELGFLAVFISP